MKIRATAMTIGIAAALLLAATACNGDDDDTASPSTTAAPAADCDPARPATPTTEPQTFTFAGAERSYLLFLPDDYDGTTAVPLAFGFHGHGGSKEVAEAASQLGAKGSARGYAVILPDALGAIPAWNFGGDPGGVDDFAFVNALIDDLSDKLCIDAERLYAAGHSNGSAFTGFLGCHEPQPFAATAMVAAFIPPTCTGDAVGPSVLAIHGTDDPGVPYEGGSVAGGPTQIPPALKSLDNYRDAFECDPTPVETSPQEGVERKAYEGCTHDREAVLVSVVGGGHEWPIDRFAATDAIFDFFDAHTKP
jgi:polyhydroxybutyrate depolymerase